MGQARLSDYIQGQAPPGTTSVWPWGVQRRMGSKVMPMSTLCGGGDPADFSAEYKGLRPPTPGPVTSREQGLLDIGDQTSQEYLQEALKERKRQRQCHCHKGCLRGSVQEFFSCGVSSWSPKFAFSWPTFTHLISSPFISPLYFYHWMRNPEVWAPGAAGLWP